MPRDYSGLNERMRYCIGLTADLHAPSAAKHAKRAHTQNYDAAGSSTYTGYAYALPTSLSRSDAPLLVGLTLRHHLDLVTYVFYRLHLATGRHSNRR